MKKLLFLLLFAMSSLTVNAQTSTASPKIISIGKKVLMGLPDCGIWLEKDSLVLNTQKQSWLLGYLSGINASGRYTSDFLEKLTSPNQAYIYVDNHCQKNPLSNVSEAAAVLIGELLAKK